MLHDSQTNRGSLKMYVRHVDECDAKTEHARKIDVVCQFIDDDLACQHAEFPQERTVIFTESDESARKVTISLHAKKYRTCILTADLFEACHNYTEQERMKFITGSGRVAICSVDVFERANLPLVEHYVFFEIPSAKLGAFGNILNIIEQKTNEGKYVTAVDTITSNLQNKDSLRALVMEMELRDSALPQWLMEAVSDVAGSPPQLWASDSSADAIVPPETKAPLQNIAPPSPNRVLHASNTNQPPVPKPVRKVVDRLPDSFDCQLKPDAQGRYIVPAKYTANFDDDEDEAEELGFYDHDYENFEQNAIDAEFNYD